MTSTAWSCSSMTSYCFRPHSSTHISTQSCAFCQHESETNWHCLDVPIQKGNDCLNNWSSNLRAIATKQSLHPSIFRVYWLGLLTIQTNNPYSDIADDLPPALQPIILTQTHLGWEQLCQTHITPTLGTSHWSASPIPCPIWLPSQGPANPSSVGMCPQNMAPLQHAPSQWCQTAQPPQLLAGCDNFIWTCPTTPLEAQEALFQCPLHQMLNQSPVVLCTWLVNLAAAQSH